MKFLQRIEKEKDSWFLIFTAFIFFLLRLPSLFEPYWYGDEGVYHVLGFGINNGRLLYQQIWDNKPPLLYLLYALFSSDQFTVRLVSMIFGLLSVFVFYFLARKLFSQKRKIILFTTFIFAIFFGLPLLEGNIANAENFMILPILLSGFIIYKIQNHSQQSMRNKLATAGFLLGLAFLFKVVAVFDFAAFFLFIFISNFDNKKEWKNLIEDLVAFCISFGAPIFASLLFFLIKGALKDFVSAAFFQNVGYVGYGNSFIIPQGFLILKLLLLGAFSFFIFAKRKTIDNAKIFIFLWFAFSIFNAFFSQRPYTHYLLVLLASFCLFAGLLFDEKYKKFSALIFVILSLIIIRSFTLYNKTISYYQNYLSFVFFQKNVYSYRSFFDRNTPRDYAVADYLKTYLGKNDQIFIWGNNAQLYYLVKKLPPGKYTIAYHILSSKNSLYETQKALEKVKPKFIIISPSTFSIPFSLQLYMQKVMLYDTVIYERIY